MSLVANITIGVAGAIITIGAIVALVSKFHVVKKRVELQEELINVYTPDILRLAHEGGTVDSKE